MRLIFAGAGASKAVNTNNYPTTIDFYDRLPIEIRDDELFKAVDSYLKQKKGGKDAAIDIEEILWTMDDLQIEANNFGTGNSLLGHFLAKPEVRKTYDLSSVQDLSKEVASRVFELSREINRQVFNLYAELPSTDELDKCWAPLLEGILGRENWVEIFTTNYDQVIESALNQIKQRGGDLPEIKTGRKSGVRPQMDFNVWEIAKSNYENLKGGGIFTKLHGSIDWSKSGNVVYIGNPTFSGDDSRHLILYPSYKEREGRSIAPPFKLFHEHLRLALNHADTLVFIGFAFRDERINKLLKNHISSEASVFIINPSDLELSRVGFPTKNVVTIKKGFDGDSVKELLMKIG